VRHPKERLFPGADTSVDQNQIRDCLRNGKFFLACDAMRSEQHEKAIEAFEELNMPYASYHQAHVSTTLHWSEKLFAICDRLWENPAKVARQSSEKKGKVKNIFLVKMPLLIHFIHPNMQKYIQNCLKIAPNVIKINSIPI
jgi:hypothetical protein